MPCQKLLKVIDEHELEAADCLMLPAGVFDQRIEEFLSNGQVESASSPACRSLHTAGTRRTNAAQARYRTIRRHVYPGDRRWWFASQVYGSPLHCSRICSLRRKCNSLAA